MPQVKLLAGPTHSALGEFSGCGPTGDEIKWGPVMRQVAEYIYTADVTIVVEYLNRFENYFLTSVALFLLLEESIIQMSGIRHISCKY